MFRAIIMGPYQDELAEGFGSSRTAALADAKSNLDTMGRQQWEIGAATVEYHNESRLDDDVSGNYFDIRIPGTGYEY